MHVLDLPETKAYIKVLTSTRVHDDPLPERQACFIILTGQTCGDFAMHHKTPGNQLELFRNALEGMLEEWDEDDHVSRMLG